MTFELSPHSKGRLTLIFTLSRVTTAVTPALTRILLLVCIPSPLIKYEPFSLIHTSPDA